MIADRNEAAIQAAALAITLGLIALAVTDRMAAPAIQMEAPKPTQIAMSMVEQPPPSAPPPPKPPPPVQTTPSPLPPPPPRPRHVRPRQQPPRPVAQPSPAPSPERAPAPVTTQPAAQAPENHSADTAYIGRLHAIVARHVHPPDTPAWRLTHPTGEVLVAFRLARDGTVSAVRVQRASGYAIIDAQGLSIVSAQSYPPMPQDVFAGQAFHDFTVPVSIKWAGAADSL